MYVVGIDPGKNGAIVGLDIHSSYGFCQRLEYDENGTLLTRLPKVKIKKIYIEDIYGRGGWGAKSVFAMGFYYGQLVYYLRGLDIPLEFVRARDWQGWAHSQIELTKGRNSPKTKSLLAYKKLFPNDPVKSLLREGKKLYHDGVIDGTMIAGYGVMKEKGIFNTWEFR